MPIEQNPELTPLLRQYQQIKKDYPDAILFFRLGDFYEMFYEDAVIASKILGIALTSRDKRKEEPVPLCGIPYHAAASYTAKLIKAGRRVAICEQTEDPKKAKGIVKREVIRVITPGTVLDADMLEAKDNNYLTAIAFSGPSSSPHRLGLASVDLSTGEFYLSMTDDDLESLHQELSRIDPREVLFPQDSKHPVLKTLERRKVYLHPYPPETFAVETASAVVLKHFGVDFLSSLGCEDDPSAVAAAGALLHFLQETQKTALSHITTLKFRDVRKTMGFDETAQKNLGLVLPKTSLFHLLDHTLTPMGARMLRSWILHPLLDREQIHLRQRAVEELLERFSLRSELRGLLSQMMDMERLIGRISLKTASPRDLSSLATSLGPFPHLERCLSECRSERAVQLRGQLTDLIPLLFRIRDLIDHALVDSPPPSLSEGGVIREGYSQDLDEIRSISREGKGWITQLETQERSRTGIESLKIRYNRVFGYYIEISRNRLKDVPPDYIRKQTLANAERFFTPELKSYEDKVLGAEERCRDLEETLFEEVRGQVAMEVRQVQKAAGIVAEMDVLAALSEAAHLYHYVKPEIHEDTTLRIIEGRHPLVERMSPTNEKEGFVPNDTEMDCDERQIMVLTGPNMAGKSTYMRQVALIVLMAQMGSFVPAREASIGLVDRIFTRIGASDNLVEGRSTFMVEMEETAEILQFATPRSLILLDEIGRGTSTFDGISIAWSVAEYLRRHNRAKTLFATHYHELTELALTEPGIFNMRMLVREWNDEVIFLRKLADGPADKSYGIQVARLADLPDTVIRRAREILANLEASELDEAGVPRVSQSVAGNTQDPSRLESQPQIPLFQPPPHPVLTELKTLDPMNMTPLQALSKLEELKRKVY